MALNCHRFRTANQIYIAAEEFFPDATYGKLSGFLLGGELKPKTNKYIYIYMSKHNKIICDDKRQDKSSSISKRALMVHVSWFDSVTLGTSGFILYLLPVYVWGGVLF